MDRKPSEVDTVELPVSSMLWPQTGSARVEVDLAALTHQGLVRSHNQDHYLVVRFGRTLEALLTSLPAGEVPARSEEVGYGLLVADGIGGRTGGEVASRVAISTLMSLVLHTPDWVLSTEPEEAQRVLERFADRFRRIQAVLRDQGDMEPELAGMGTTMTLACSLGASLVVAHIGDSRAYLLRGGKLCRMTRDHTLVQAMLDTGQITPEEAAKHPWRHMLTRSLSAGGTSYEGQFKHGCLADGDQLLLCTDGLTEMVDEPSIAAILQREGSANAACQALVAAALANGGKDNVTVALARYRFPG
jgi:protein phosphatase